MILVALHHLWLLNWAPVSPSELKSTATDLCWCFWRNVWPPQTLTSAVLVGYILSFLIQGKQMFIRSSLAHEGRLHLIMLILLRLLEISQVSDGEFHISTETGARWSQALSWGLRLCSRRESEGCCWLIFKFYWLISFSVWCSVCRFFFIVTWWRTTSAAWWWMEKPVTTWRSAEGFRFVWWLFEDKCVLEMDL